MRKAQKKQAEDFLKVLEEAHKEIRRTIENKNYSAALGLLEDCQQGAISLGEMIESFEGEDCAAIPFLEEYCEVVYQCHENIFQRVSGNGNKVYKLLRSFLLKIERSIKNDIKVNTEILFLPYKASMWDSLESVWMAANKDPNCDAYVIPVPYYDRKPDGSFGELHYEGALYPEYVPVTWYGDYDFESRKPDVIFIHNPYDQYNYVTSVFPAFYSQELKKYTDYLVYIPYFISGICFNDPKEISDSKPYHWTSGAINADLIVVHSEVVKTAMVRSGYQKEKIQVLGTPKIDSIVRAMKEEISIPESWKNKIQNRKVILYNTSVTNFLNYESKYKRDMLDVIEEKIEYLVGEEDFSLIWRPHPLLEQTIISMRPDKLEHYRSIKERVQKSPKDILDETSSPLLSMLISDALISDFSSLMKEYLATGKPVLALDLSGRKKPKNCGVDMFAFYYSRDGFNAHKLCAMLRENTDEHRNDRLMAFENSYVNCDGTAGEKIYSYVIDKIKNNG